MHEGRDSRRQALESQEFKVDHSGFSAGNFRANPFRECYGTGARRIEAAHLKVGDIDSKRMVVHIHGGKGNRDRDVMLTQTLLDALRDYWRGLRRKPTEWLFPGNRWHTGIQPITPKVVWLVRDHAAQRAGARA